MAKPRKDGKPPALKLLPKAFRQFVRERTDWDAVLAAIKDLAFGLYEVQQLNDGQERVYRRAPDDKALRMLAEIGWGKPGLMEEDADQAGIKQTAVVFVVPAQDMTRLVSEQERVRKEIQA